MLDKFLEPLLTSKLLRVVLVMMCAHATFYYGVAKDGMSSTINSLKSPFYYGVAKDGMSNTTIGLKSPSYYGVAKDGMSNTTIGLKSLRYAAAAAGGGPDPMVRPAAGPDPMVRTAYLITINATAPRTLHAVNVLERSGFNVSIEIAPFVGNKKFDKFFSNKKAHFNIYDKIINDTVEWSYIFEDDIALCKECRGDKSDFFVNKTLVCHEENKDKCFESKHDKFMFLGICRPRGQKNNTGHCGRCTHAYGITRVGAKSIIEHDKTIKGKMKYFTDVITEGWCKRQGGFPVTDLGCFNKRDKSHRGTFIQDRNSYKTLLGSVGS